MGFREISKYFWVLILLEIFSRNSISGIQWVLGLGPCNGLVLLLICVVYLFNSSENSCLLKRFPGVNNKGTECTSQGAGCRRKSHGNTFHRAALITRFMGPIWGRQDPGGPHVGPMNFNIWVILGLHPANERQHYFVRMSLIGWAQA